MRQRRARRPARRALWMAAYLACFVLVLSFIFFEVLDVDGSDFDYAPSRLSIKLAEAGHDDDIRRFSLGGGGLAPAPVVTVATAVLSPTITRRLGPSPSVSLVPGRVSRAALARSLLSDVPPSV